MSEVYVCENGDHGETGKPCDCCGSCPGCCDCEPETDTPEQGATP